MTNLEVIQRVQSLYSKGAQSDDSRLSNRHIYNKLISVRSKLITDRVKKRQIISHLNYQLLPCVELIEAPIHECACVPDLGCVVLRSKYPLPEILTDIDSHLIESVTTLDSKIKIDETTWNALSFEKGNRYTKNSPKYYMRNGYLYLTHNKVLEVLSLSAIFADFIEAENFPSYCPTTTVDCTSPLDKEFPMDHDMIDTAVRLTTDELVLMFSQLKEDKISNASDDGSSVKMPKNQRYIE